MSRRDSSRITPVLQRQYRDAARAGDWVRCRILAEQMRGLERDNARWDQTGKQGCAC
jgi:hypothetical protein